MKKGEVGQFKASWWKTSQPKGLNTAGKFELTLKAYETSMAKLKSSPGEDAKKFALDQLELVEQACDKVVAEAKKAKADDMVATVQALGKLDFKGERAAIEAQKGGKEEEEDDELGDVADPKLFAVLLRKGLNKVKNATPEKPAKFGFAVGATRKEDRMAFGRSGGGRELANAVAKPMGSKKITFGTVIPSEDEATTLVLSIVGARLPGLAKKVRGLFKRYKPQPFKDVVLMVDGQVVQDEADPDDLEAEDPDEAVALDPAAELARLRAEMAALADRIKAAAVSAPDQRLALSEQATLFRSAFGKSDVPGASGAVTALKDLLAAIEARAGTGGGAPGGGTAGQSKIAKSAQIWTATSARVEEDVRKLRDALEAEFKDSEELHDVMLAFQDRIWPLEQRIRDAAITHALQDLDKAADAEQRSKLLAEAKDILAQQRALIDGEKLLQDIDNNPFVPLTIHKTVSATLTALEAAIA